MPFLLLALAVAVAAAVMTGGSVPRVAERTWRRPAALFFAVVIQIVVEFGPISHRSNVMGFGLLLVSYGLLLSFCALNVSQRGMAIVAVGIALNALVITVDSGMPVQVPAGHHVSSTVKHHARTDRDHLVGLSDVIMVGPVRQTLSLGDLVLAGGLVVVMIYASRRPRRLSARDRHLIQLHADLAVRLARLGQVGRAGSSATTRSSAASTRGSYT